MKRNVRSLWLMVAAVLLIGCTPPERIPGEVELEFRGRDATNIYLRLRNQSPKQISFHGARDWWRQGVFPMGPQFECILADPDLMHDSPIPLIDGPAWRKFVIGPGEEIELAVDDSFLRGSDGKFPNGRCKFVLHLGGNAMVKSEEFESDDTSSL